MYSVTKDMLANAEVTQKDDKLHMTHIFQNYVWLQEVWCYNLLAFRARQPALKHNEYL